MLPWPPQTATSTIVSTGYQEELFILAFDHRGSFQKQWFGIDGDPTAEETERIAGGKALIEEGLALALSNGVDAQTAGALIDEQFGAPLEIPARVRASGMKLAMPVEKTGQVEFDFEYGEAFGDHIERFDPDFCKVLVRYNPEAAAGPNRRQAQRLRTLSRWLGDRGRRFLFELLVPATDAQLRLVEGDPDRYDTEVRPGLTTRAIAELQAAEVEPDIWKVEGFDQPDDCERIVTQCRANGRDEVSAIVLGRGADQAKVERWLEVSAGVDGYVGFAIGRSIWGPPLSAFLSGDLDRESARRQITQTYLRFRSVYKTAAG